MTTTLTEEMTEKLKIHRPLRTYFDSGSHEFSQTDYDEKIRTLAKIVSAGYDLNTVVKQYKSDYNSDGYRHIYNHIIPTIKEHISYINSGKVYDPRTLKPLENATDKEVVKLFTDTIREKVLSSYTIEKLILSYVEFKFNHNGDEYKALSKFFNIDFELDNDQQLFTRNEKEKLDKYQWGYVALNQYLKLGLFGNLHNNSISDLNPVLDMPMTKGIIYFIHKHYPKSIHHKLESDSEFRKAKILGFIKDLVEILYLDKPLFDFNIFFIRNNFKVDKFRDEVLEKNQAAILVDQDYEKEDWDLLLSGEKRKHKRTEFIGRWLNLDKSLKEKDALLVSAYLGKDKIKIGLLPKDSTYFSHPDNNDFKVFQLENAIEIDKNENQIFSSLIPAQTTLSPIYQRTSFIVSKYFGLDLPITLENLSPTSVEIICTEWLRSDLAPIEFQLKFQLLKTGGNFPNIDIYGVTKDGHELAAQVSITSNKSRIEKKVKQLSKTNIKIQVMFCDTDREKDFGIPTISIRKVFDDLSSNGYGLLLDKLVGQ